VAPHGLALGLPLFAHLSISLHASDNAHCPLPARDKEDRPESGRRSDGLMSGRRADSHFSTNHTAAHGVLCGTARRATVSSTGIN
jgi:hypothetical protein